MSNSTPVQIAKLTIDPDEYLISQGMLIQARVIHALRSASGQNFKTMSGDYLGTVGNS